MLKAEILLVDDAKIFLDIQKDFLKYSPVHITTAYNGIEALEIARRKQPDLIVMDVAMPQLDGVSCCKSLRNEPGLSSIPVILTSTNSGHDDIISYKNAGCNAILHKPLQRREFLNRLRDFLPAIDRREPRIPCRMPATIKTDSGIFTGIVHNIAMNGLYVETSHDLKSECEAVLSFRLPPGDDRAIVARGRITWRNCTDKAAGNGLPRGFGVEFTEITGEDGTYTGYNQLELFITMRDRY
jgi:CheY-like chemotaxis protein/Tfp pilus assembly protein PilZ